MSQAEEVYVFDKPSVKGFNEYKTAYLKNKKKFVCSITSSLSSNSSNSNCNLIFAVKSEKIMNSLCELL